MKKEVKKYLGVKVIEASPMTAQEARLKGYNAGSLAHLEEGYEVKYSNGHMSWSPKVAFDMSHTELGVKEPTDGATTILKERWEQLNIHGITIESDAKYEDDVLLEMAKYCIDPIEGEYPFEFEGSDLIEKLANKSEIERLAIAGAFLAARIDVLRQG